MAQYEASFVLALWCDHDVAHVAVFKGRTFLTCSHQAKKKGWRIHTPNKTATCPACWAADHAVKVEYKRRKRA